MDVARVEPLRLDLGAFHLLVALADLEVGAELAARVLGVAHELDVTALRVQGRNEVEQQLGPGLPIHRDLAVLHDHGLALRVLPAHARTHTAKHGADVLVGELLEPLPHVLGVPEVVALAVGRRRAVPADENAAMVRVGLAAGARDHLLARRVEHVGERLRGGEALLRVGVEHVHEPRDLAPAEKQVKVVARLVLERKRLAAARPAPLDLGAERGFLPRLELGDDPPQPRLAAACGFHLARHRAAEARHRRAHLPLLDERPEGQRLVHRQALEHLGLVQLRAHRRLDPVTVARCDLQRDLGGPRGLHKAQGDPQPPAT